MKKIFSFFIVMLISASIFAQVGDKLSAGELYAGTGYNAIIPLHGEEDGDQKYIGVWLVVGGGDLMK